MNILFDHQVFCTQHYGGVSRYFVELARALGHLDECVPKLFAPAYVNKYLTSTDPLHRMSFPLPWPQKGMHRRPALVSPLLRAVTVLSDVDVVHETGYGAPLFRYKSSVKVVTTLHDMTVERYPTFFDNFPTRRAQKYEALARADAIVCISAATQSDLLDFYPEFQNKSTVVHHGVSRAVVSGPRTERLPPRYMLYVGTRQTYKNFSTLVQALGQAAVPEDLKLVCFGGGELTVAERDALQAVGWSSERVVYLEGDDQLLAQAYKYAELFVFPSTYEGFGMPLTEAMTQGCPIVCSRATSFPEVCGDAAAYFDPMDAYQLAAALSAVTKQPAYRQQLAAASAARAQMFTWERCAAQTAEVYRRVLGLGGRP